MKTYIFSQFTGRTWRSLSVLGAVALGATLFVALSAMGAGFRAAAKAPLAGVAADIVISRPLETAQPAGTTRSVRGIQFPFGMAAMSGADVDAIRQTAGVAGMAVGLQLWDFGPKSYVTLLGLDTSQSGASQNAMTGTATPAVGPVAMLEKDLVNGRTFKPGERAVAVADLHYAAFFSLKPGATVTIADKPFELIGIIEIREGSQAAAANLYIPLPDAQALAGLQPNQVDQVYVQVASASEVDAVVGRITGRLGKVSALTEDSMLQVMGGIGQVSARFSLVAALVGLIGGLLLAWIALSGLVAERQREIGVMKAVGWQRRDVERAFLAEALLLSLAGGLLGILVGWGSASLMGQITMPDIAGPANQTLHALAALDPSEKLALPAQVDALTVGLALLAAVAGGAFAGWLGARQAAALKPAQVLRQR